MNQCHRGRNCFRTSAVTVSTHLLLSVKLTSCHLLFSLISFFPWTLHHSNCFLLLSKPAIHICTLRYNWIDVASNVQTFNISIQVSSKDLPASRRRTESQNAASARFSGILSPSQVRWHRGAGTLGCGLCKKAFPHKYLSFPLMFLHDPKAPSTFSSGVIGRYQSIGVLARSTGSAHSG